MNIQNDLKNELFKLLFIDNEIRTAVKQILIPEGEELVTKSYFDERLLQLTIKFDERLEKEEKLFDTKLEKQSQDFNAKMEKQSQDFREELKLQSQDFNAKMEKQSQDFREELKLQQIFMERQLKDLKLFITNQIRALGSKWGLGAELTFRKGMNEILKDFGGNVSKWNKRVKWITEQGLQKEKEYEIDIIIQDGKTSLIEIKSSCIKESMEKFIEACNVYEQTEKYMIIPEKIMICIYIDEHAKKLAEQHNIEIIEHDE